jgi:hypothetical protein
VNPEVSLPRRQVIDIMHTHLGAGAGMVQPGSMEWFEAQKKKG